VRQKLFLELKAEQKPGQFLDRAFFVIYNIGR